MPDIKIYQSPTTPNLLITFRAYLIELICLNINPNLENKFWQDTWWSNKFKRELRGVKRLSELLNFNDPIMRSAIMMVIREGNIKSFCAIKTINNFVRLAEHKYKLIIEERKNLYEGALKRSSEDNFKFVKVCNKPTTISRIRMIENEQKE